VLLQNLSDKFLKDPSVEFPPGRLVAGKVLALKADERLVDLSLRPSVVVGKAAYRVLFDDLQEGMKVNRSRRYFYATIHVGDAWCPD